MILRKVAIRIYRTYESRKLIV